jgi:glycosyltransferase involved in cell wall biosynthesis
MLDGKMMIANQEEGDKLLVPLYLRVVSRWFNTLYNHFKSSFSNSSGKELDWVSAFVLKRFLHSRKVNAVLAEYGPTGVAVMEACRKAQVPLIVHFHGFDAHHKPILDSYINHYQRMFVYASAMVVVSRNMEQQLLQLGAPREKVHYNVCGVDIDQFTDTCPDKNPPVFIAVGRFVDKKAPHLTLLAFRKVLDRCSPARLIMIANGPLLEPCRHIAYALRIAYAVEFLGPKNHNEVAKAMQGARSFIQHSVTTSYGDSEGTPVGILEAGASGIPVVSTRHAGIADVVIENETGFLVDEFDVDGMVEHMIQLAEKPELALQMGQRARKHIEDNFSMQKSINTLWNIILKCINKG